MESRNASFFEDVFPCFNKEDQTSSSKDKEIVREDEQVLSEEEEVEPRRSKRARVEKSFGPDFLTYVVESEPKTYHEAITSSEGPQWKEAIKSEIESILQNHTWELVDLPPGSKPLDLEEEIYMEQPEGFVAPGQENKVCKFIKSLYGLKQALKQWHQKFDQAMLESGFKINEYDKCVYMKDTTHGYVILCLYVDDMLIIGSDDKMIRSTKDMLKSKFDMKDLGLTK
ncbi:hypothetical protein L6452_05648 [Arctium lappa]|uniref:Uncharacterized protein n=1 Tax=Arctium lappa TaxID=4217 RepID=A0ACB9EGZ8_ARCLA|nr:hypothetical protein L6452_05648 [Arctium lappa]